MSRSIVSAVLAVLLIATGCSSVRQVVPTPSASIEGVELAGVSLTAATLRFQVKIDNPYGTTLPLVGMDYAVSSRGTTFLEGELTAHETIPAGESATVPLDVRLPYQALRDIGASVRPGAEIPYSASLGLELDAPVVGVVRVPAARDGTLSIPAFP